MNVVIVGGGLSGLTCSLYLARYGINTFVFKNYSNGALEETPLIENFPGFPNGISGLDLLSNIEQQAINSGVTILENKVTKILDPHTILLDSNDKFKYDILVLATGRSYKKLEAKNIELFKHIHYCATCDGALYKNKDVVVVGGGNTALTDAITLSNIANQVTIIIRRNQFKADNYLINKITNINNIRVKTLTKINEFTQDGIITNNGFIKTDAVFVAIGTIPNIELLNNIEFVTTIDLNNLKDAFNKFKDYNIYLTGDIHNIYHQAIIAAGDGAKTACDIYNNHFLKY